VLLEQLLHLLPDGRLDDAWVLTLVQFVLVPGLGDVDDVGQQAIQAGCPIEL
jgi:hypothetical protein